MKKIAFIAQPEYFRFIYENYLNDDFEVKEFQFTFHQTPDFYESILKYDPDYLICFRGEYFDNAYLNKIRGVKIALSSEPFPRIVGNTWEYTKDSFQRYMTFRSIRTKSFDYVFHYDIGSAELFTKDNLPISGEFTFPVARDVYFPCVEEIPKKYDIFFIGRSTRHREELFGKLKHTNKFLHIAHGVYGEELVKFIHQSKICINAHAENEISWEPRVQMMIATGTMLLSEKITPNRYLTPNKDYIEYSDQDDLYRKAIYYLENATERKKIEENGLITINTYFDSLTRFRELIDSIESGKFAKFNPNTKKNQIIDLINVFINDMNILYVLNAVTISGGVAVVLKHVNMLLENGYNASVLSLNKDVDPSWFKGNKAIIYTLDDLQTLEKTGIDLVIATHFSTVEYVKRIKSERKAYFVQSDERRFDLPTSKLYLECTNSYSEDFEFITEAIWIQRWLKEEFGKNAYYIPNGLDLETFKPTKPIIPKNKKTRVLLEGSIAYGFKGMKDAYEVVKNLDVEIWIVSNNGKPYEDWKYDRFFESVNMYEMNKIYSSCDILVKMSKVEGFFGPPLEAMACGCAVVVGKVTGYDEYIVHEKNALVVEMGDVEKATEYVKKLQVDKDLFDNLVSNGRSTSEEWGWEVSEKYLLHFIEKREIAIKYKSDFPERYDFEIENKKITTRLLNLSSNCEQELRLTEQYCRELKLENESLRAQINNIERTKIWRIRRKILRLKDKLNKWKE